MNKLFLLLACLGFVGTSFSAVGCRGVERDRYSPRIYSLAPRNLSYQCACPCNKISGPDGFCDGCGHTGDMHRGVAHTRRTGGHVEDHSGVFQKIANPD